MLTRILALGSVLAAPVAAHDFWIQPARFATTVGAAVPITLFVGHGAFRQRWGVDAKRVVRFVDIGPAGTVDRRGELHTDSGASDAELSFATPGTHVMVLESNVASSTLPAIRFNDYLKVEGLTPAIAQRARLGTSDRDGREVYSRRAKALVQVGQVAGPQLQVTRPVGLTLEIVPQKSPYALLAGEALPLLILYEGKPLSGATVKLNNLDFDSKPLAERLTGAGGQVSFDVPRSGRWQLNVVWTKPIANNPAADFATVFSSLTFGYERPLPR